jgi:hypothetical protein
VIAGATAEHFLSCGSGGQWLKKELLQSNIKSHFGGGASGTGFNTKVRSGSPTTLHYWRINKCYFSNKATYWDPVPVGSVNFQIINKQGNRTVGKYLLLQHIYRRCVIHPYYM